MLDVTSGQATTQGANLVQADDTNAASQHWQVIDAGSGYFKIKNSNSNYVADVNGGSPLNNANIIQYLDQNGNNQQWQLVKVN